MPDDPKDDKGQDGLKKLLDKANGDAMALAADLYADNHRWREANRQLKGQVETLEKSLPPDGSVVLSKADSERWEAYKTLGKPDDLRTALTERDSLKSDLARSQRDERMRKAFKAAEEDVDFWRPLLLPEVDFETKTETKDGQQVEASFVIVKTGDSSDSKPLSEYLKAQHQTHYEAAQKLKEQAKGTPYLEQRKSDTKKPAPKNFYEGIREREQVKKESGKAAPDAPATRIARQRAAVR